MSSKQIQKLKDEIEALKQKNRELVIENQEVVNENQDLQKENLEFGSVKSKLTAKIEEYKNKIQDLEKENRDQKKAHKEDIQNLERKIRDYQSINAGRDTEIQRLQRKNRELVIENQEVVDENQDLQKLCAKFSNSEVYNRITLSPVSVDKLQHCTEWWCPKHSKFATIVRTFKPKNEEDKLIVDRAKSRFRYWNNKDDGETCCKNNRQNKDRNKYLPPSNWPK